VRAESSTRSANPNSQAAIAFLRDIVAIYSPSKKERPVAEQIVQSMCDWGYDAEVDDAGNAVGRMGHGKRHILLLGHIDTVPGEIPVKREGDLLYGRGSVDAKGPFATFVIAAARAGILPGTRVTVVGAVEEETATSKGAYYVAEHYEIPDYVVIGEPSAWNRITIAYKGRLLVDYTLERPMSHTAGRERGACEQAVEFWLEVLGQTKAYNKDKNRHFSTLDPSLRSIRSSSDGFSERLEMQLGLRLPLGFDVDAFVAEMESFRGAAEINTWAYEQPFRASKRNALVSAFRSSIRDEGGRPAYVSKTGTSDMNVLGPHWGCPIAAYGPGDSHLDHTPNEHIDLEEYLMAIRVLERVLRRLAQM